MKKEVVNSPIRWAGSKKKLLNEMLEKTFVRDCENYVECFLGSGVVLLNVLNKIGDSIRLNKESKEYLMNLISKIDARNGAYGIVPKELEDAIITGNFWAFEINKDEILPQYITYLMRHNFFTHMCILSYNS